MKVCLIYVNKTKNIAFGVGYIASAAIEAGHQLLFLDTAYLNTEQVLDKVMDFNPELVAMSSMSLTWDYTLDLCKRIKNVMNVPILVGGLHVTIIQKEALQNNCIDYICVGEGESTFIEFLNNFGSKARFSVRNIGYKNAEQIFINNVRPPEDRCKLPKFHWEIWDNRSIIDENGTMGVTLTRGCPFNCTYCCNSCYLKLYGSRYIGHRDINSVIQELVMLRDRYNPKKFYITDEMWLSGMEWVKKFCEVYQKKVGIPFGSMARAEFLSEKVVSMLKKAGCEQIGVGVECGDEKYRKKMLNRKISNDLIIKTFKLLHKYHIRSISFNMIGLPFETEKRMEKTVQLNKMLKPSYVQFTIFYPFRGTELYNICKEEIGIDYSKNPTNNYYYESVLKGKTLHFKRQELDLLFNHHPILYYFYKLLPNMFKDFFFRLSTSSIKGFLRYRWR